MNAFSYINDTAASEIGRADFLAAELAERTARRSSAAAERIQAQREMQDAERAFIASREPEHDADRAEAQQQIDAAHALVTIYAAALRQAQREFALVGGADHDFADTLAELFSDQFTDKALARVFLASVKLGVC